MPMRCQELSVDIHIDILCQAKQETPTPEFRSTSRVLQLANLANGHSEQLDLTTVKLSL